LKQGTRPPTPGACAARRSRRCRAGKIFTPSFRASSTMRVTSASGAPVSVIVSVHSVCSATMSPDARACN
jgi:hypothetical protein